MKNNLTTKQKRFADLFIETGDKQKSYLKAYQTAKPGSAAAAATRLLNNVKVKEYIEIRQEQIDSEVFKHQIATKERILHEDSCIALARVGDIFDDNGNIKELEDIPAVVCSPNALLNMTFSTLMHNTFAEGYFFAYDRHTKADVQEGAF